MKIAIICLLVHVGLASSTKYELKIKNDGSTILGGTVEFTAEVFDDGAPSEGPFTYEWVDNSIAQHSITHYSNFNKDEWRVSYTANDRINPGSYIATLTVKKLINSILVPIATKQSSISVTRHLHGAFLVTTAATDTDYIATHKIVLTTPNAKYLENNGASISTHWYVDGVFYTVTNGLTFTMKYPKLYRRIGVQALVVAELHVKKEIDNSETVYTYIDNLLGRPIIYHYGTCNASFPYINTNNNIEINKNAILGCFTRTFRLWDSLRPQNLFMTSGSLDGFNFAGEKILHSQNWELDRITDPFVKTIVSDRIDAINQRIPILAKTSTMDYSTLEAKMQHMKEAERMELDRIQDPFVKSIVDNRMNGEAKRLLIKSKELDPRFKESIDKIRSQRPVVRNARKSLIKSIDKKNNIIPNGQNIVQSTAYDINQRINDLKDAESKILDRIHNPTIQGIVLDKIHEHNKKLPVLLKSKTGDISIPQVLHGIHDKINEEMQRSSDPSFDDIEDPLAKEVVINKLEEHNKMLAEQSNEIDSNLEIPLNEVRKKIMDLKEAENSAVEGVTDPDTKEELISTIEKENENIPTLMLPFVMGKNFSFVLDVIRSKLGTLTDNEASVTRNVTDPFIQSMIASKFDKVNYILNTKFKLLSDGFSSVLNPLTTSVDDSGITDTRKVPVLTKTIDSETINLEFPASLASNFSIALDAINERINNLKDTTSTVIQNATIPAIQALIASKLDKVNTILSTKYKELSNNFTTIIDTITAKLANASYETSTQKTKKPKKIPKLGLSLDYDYVDDTTELITNYTTALDTLRTKLDDLENFDVITQNITNPFAQSFIANKMNVVKYIVNTKYKQLSDNFTNFLNTISAKSDESKKVPKLKLSPESDIEELSMPATIATNFSVALDAITARIDDLKNTTNIITQNITDPIIQSIVSTKLDKVASTLDKKYKDITDSFAEIIDVINSKLTNATDDMPKKSTKKTKKIPKLGKTKDPEATDEYASETSDVIANFTIALDAIRTRIDDLKNLEDVITQNITNPFAQAIVASKLDRINFILKTKYKILNDNFTTIMDTIDAKLENAASSTIGGKTVPKLTKAFGVGTNYNAIIDLIHAKISGKQKPVDATVKYIIDPTVRNIVMNKIIEENKNLTTIADNIEASLASSLDEFTKKAQDLNTLEDLTIDNVEDPDLQADIINQIDEENDKIPLLTVSKHDTMQDSEKSIQYTPTKSMFKIKFPTAIRF